MVLHVDLNSFFARVEQQANPKLRNRPIGILGKGHKGARTCVCALSPEAKRFGLHSGISVWEASRTCPEIILVPPDYAKYLAVSRHFFEILDRVTPWVEIFSIDEGFLRIDGDLSVAQRAAAQIKSDLRAELGELITVTIGIAWGKIFAKLAGELQKPDGLVILTKDNWLAQVGHLPVTKLCGIGYQLNHHLAQIGITTIADLTHLDAGTAVARFGRSLGIRLTEIGHGQDLAPVCSSQILPPPKSIGHQLTLDTDQHLRALWPIIAKLTKKVGRRLRRSHQATEVIALHFSLSDQGFYQNHLKQRPAIRTDSDLLRASRYLFETSSLPSQSLIRRVGFVAHMLQPSTLQPLPLDPKIVREEQLTNQLDQLCDRYGEDVIEWGSAWNGRVGDLRDWRGPHAVMDR